MNYNAWAYNRGRLDRHYRRHDSVVSMGKAYQSVSYLSLWILFGAQNLRKMISSLA